MHIDVSINDIDFPKEDTLGNLMNAIPFNLRDTSGITQFFEKIDYSNPDNWLSLPSVISKNVDVFYFYPTTYVRTNMNQKPALCGINDFSMRLAAKILLNCQASVFEESCNIYAPFYRQYDLTSLASFSDKILQEHLQFISRQDPTDALNYYFQHLNNNRPFILAAHSQGSIMSTYLLKEYFKGHPQYAERMICAYLIGCPIMPEDIKEIGFLKFAEGEDDIKVVISWNTESPENEVKHNIVVKDRELCINPLNWSRTDKYAPITLNKGTLNSRGKIVTGVADAMLKMERGVIIVSTPEAEQYKITTPFMTQFFGAGSFHINDYQLFYVNLKENIAKRIEKFMQ